MYILCMIYNVLFLMKFCNCNKSIWIWNWFSISNPIWFKIVIIRNIQKINFCNKTDFKCFYHIEQSCWHGFFVQVQCTEPRITKITKPRHVHFINAEIETAGVLKLFELYQKSLPIFSGAKRITNRITFFEKKMQPTLSITYAVVILLFFRNLT